MISVATHNERTIAIWNVEEGIIIKSNLPLVVYNDVQILHEESLLFMTAGANCLRLWKLEANNELLFMDIRFPEYGINDVNFTAIGVTPYLQDPYNDSLVLLGTSTGDVVIYNPDKDTFLAKVDNVAQGEIG